MIAEDIRDFIGMPTTKNFLDVAQRFLLLVEDKAIEKEPFLQELHRVLIDLYAAGHHLQEIPMKYSNENTDFDRDALFENLNARKVMSLGDEAFYWHVFDPTYGIETEPTQGWLVDDVEDIYRDLKVETIKMKLESSEAVEDALWQMKWSHRHHWGQHCVNAIQYLHYYCYDGKAVVI